MKKLILTLLMLVLIAPVFANPDPDTTLTTASLGYPYTLPFQVNVRFSEPVTGFDLSSVNIVNATIEIILSSGSNYILKITPTLPGPISIFVPANSVKSLSTGTPNKVSNKLIIMALDPILNPSSNFDLSVWNLILPIPLGGLFEAIAIDNAALNGYPILNTGYSNPPYFYTDTVAGSMNFFAPVNGATTPNCFFPRSELSEVIKDFPFKNWKFHTFSSSSLTASVLVTQVPPLKKIVIGKIQDKGTTDEFGTIVAKKSLVKLFYDLNQLDPNGKPCNGCLYARIRPVPAQDRFLKTITLANNTPLNKLFIYQIKLLRDGKLTIKINDRSTSYNLNTSTDNTVGWGTQELLFKAGVYVPENGPSNVLGGAAKFYSLQIRHTGCPEE